MKKFYYIKSAVLLSCLILFFSRVDAQVVVKKTIIITEVTALPRMNITEKNFRGIIGTTDGYPLKISANDTLFFVKQDQVDFVKAVFTGLHISSIVQMALVSEIVSPGNYNALGFKGYISYGGRPYSYYYYCNTANNHIYAGTDPYHKLNATYVVKRDDSIYDTQLHNNVRNIHTLLAKYQYKQLCESLASNLKGFDGSKYVSPDGGSQMINDGNFYFFIR